MPRNIQIVKDSLRSDSITHGRLRPYQAEEFHKQTFEATPLAKAMRHVIRTEKSGNIDKIGIGRRIVRETHEGVDDGYRAGVDFGTVPYQTRRVRVPWEASEQFFEDSIEREDIGKTVMGLMTTQTGIDIEDLEVNGNENVASTDPDYNFLKINNGIIQQVTAGGHLLDAGQSTSYGGNIDYTVFGKLLRSIPSKHRGAGLRWLMSPGRQLDWETYLLGKSINSGGIVPDSFYDSPFKIPTIEVPNMPDDCVILADPLNFTDIRTLNMRIRKDDQSKDAIYKEMRYYVIILDFDVIVEELGATGIITGLV